MASIPTDWQDRINANLMVFSPDLPTNKKLYPALSNGFLGTVFGEQWIYMAGIYVNNSILSLSSRRAQIPSPLNITLHSDNLPPMIGYALDLESGIFYRRYGNSQITVEQSWYIHRKRKHLLVHEIHVENKSSVKIQLTLKQNVPKDSPDFNFNRINYDDHVCVEGPVKVTETPDCQYKEIGLIYDQVDHTQFEIGAGEKKHMCVLATCTATKKTPLILARRYYRNAYKVREKLKSEHIKAWKELFKSRIEIEGDPQLALHVNASLYALYSCLRDKVPWAPAPGGLTNSFNGHVFWDSDIWIVPSLIPLHPELARASIQYRFNRISVAKNYAERTGYKGIRFPWQSADSGNPVDIAPFANDLEQHVTADVGICVRNYYYATLDRKWLEEIGWPLISGIADFWVSRVSYNIFTKRYDIRWVVPPDEFAVGAIPFTGVINSVYTNVAAKKTIEFAIEVAYILGKAFPKEWTIVASKITIPVSDDHHPEYTGFPLGNLFLAFKVKQADVTLLQYPLELEMSDHLRKGDLTYYESRVIKDGPAMTDSINTILWLDFDRAKAQESLNKSRRNIQWPFCVWTETPDPNHHPFNRGVSNFVTGAGGFIQSIINGYGGLRFHLNEAKFNFRLPDQVTLMNYKGLHYAGRVFNVKVNQNTVEFELLLGEPINIKEMDTGKIQTLSQQNKMIFTTTKFTLY